jgi:hypothetical protein
MDVKTTLQNENLAEDVYMIHSDGFFNPRMLKKVSKL